MGLMDYMREKIRTFLRIEPTSQTQISINGQLDFFNNVAKNKIWYEGKSDELSQLYQIIDAPGQMFWKVKSSKGQEIRKIHIGLPALIVDTLVNIVVNGYNGVTIDNPNDSTSEDLWDDIYMENGADSLIKECIRNILVAGDGAFKVSYHNEISDLPIIEWVSGEFVDFEQTFGRDTAVVFNTQYTHKGRFYTFKERYTKGKIEYFLHDDKGNEIDLHSIPQLDYIIDKGVVFSDAIMLAVPVRYGKSEMYRGRGQSIFDNKIDCFDSLDETWSQWIDAQRMGRANKYIPECFIPRDPETGELKPNSFDNRFVKIGNNMKEGGDNRISVEQPNIPTADYMNTYINALDLCLEGLISPSTIGVDVKKLDNAEAQREKEKATLYTRGNIIKILEDALPRLIKIALNTYNLQCGNPIEEYKVSINFGEYANPSFESQVETIGKAKNGGFMSVETCVEQLYGDSKEDEWKQEEIGRIKAELGIADMDEEPSVGDDAGEE